MKIHNILAFLLVGLVTATRPPYGIHSTSAKAQVGKAILVRIPLDSDSHSNQQYQGDYHEPEPRIRDSIHKPPRGNQYYGYDTKVPDTRNYQEQRSVHRPDVSSPRQQEYSYGSSSAQVETPRPKMVLIVPDGNRDSSNQGYSRPSSSYYRQPATQSSEELVYSKPLSPSGTKFSEKKNQHQTSNKEHHKVPLILITLNKEDSKQKHTGVQSSRRTPAGYGKSWQPMPTETRPQVQQPTQQYEPEPWQSKTVQKTQDSRENNDGGNTRQEDAYRSTQQTSYGGQWQQGQPIRQESYKQEQSTQSAGWREESNSRNNQWQQPIEAQNDRSQKHPQSTEEAYDQYKEQPETVAKGNNEQADRNNYPQSNSYSVNPESNTRDQYTQNYPGQNKHNYPRNYQQPESDASYQTRPSHQNYRERPVVQTVTSEYPQSHDSRHTQQNQESRYPKENQESRYPQQNQENRYQQETPDTRYQQQEPQASRYQQQNSEYVYNQQSSEPGYPQQSSESNYPQPASESNYPQQASESIYPQENTASRYQESSSYAGRQQESNQRRPNQQVYQTTTKTPVEETWTRPNVPSTNTQWHQASSYVPERDEPSKVTSNEDSYQKKEVLSYGYQSPRSAGTQAEESWETRAASERSTKTRAERTKGVVLLLLSNEDKDTYARRMMEGTGSEESTVAVPATTA